MKHPFAIGLACAAMFLATPLARGEELADFLKRTGIGNATKDDVDARFHGMVFVGDQAFEIDRDKLVSNWEGQKATKTELTVDEFTVVAKGESPDDRKGKVISVVAEVKVTEKVAGTTMKIESTSHFIVLCNTDGTFRLLYLAVPKQVRKAS